MNYMFLMPKNDLFKKGLLFSIFSFLNSGVNFFLILILAHYFSTEEYGALNLFNTCITLITPVISLSTIGYLSVAYYQKGKLYFENVVRVIVMTSLTVLFFLSLFIIFGREWLEMQVGIENKYLLFVVLICFFQVFTLINLELWRLEENPLRYGLYTLGITICNFVITLFFVVVSNEGWESRVYTLLGVSLFFSLLSICFIIKKGYLLVGFPDKVIFYQTLLFGIPLIPHQISFWIRQGLDRFIINYNFSNSAVGVFSFASNYSNIIMILGIAFNATNSVYIYKTIAENDLCSRQKLFKQTKMMFALFLVATILVIGVAYLLTPIIFPLYISSLIYVVPLCLSAFFHCVYLLFVNYIFYLNKTKKLMSITVIFSIIHMFFSLLLTRYGILITAYIGLVCNILICFSVVYYSNKIYPIFYQKRQ